MTGSLSTDARRVVDAFMMQPLRVHQLVREQAQKLGPVSGKGITQAPKRHSTGTANSAGLLLKARANDALRGGITSDFPLPGLFSDSPEVRESAFEQLQTALGWLDVVAANSFADQSMLLRDYPSLRQKFAAIAAGEINEQQWRPDVQKDIAEARMLSDMRHSTPPDAAREPFNVAFVETLQAFVLGMSWAGRSKTPVTELLSSPDVARHFVALASDCLNGLGRPTSLDERKAQVAEVGTTIVQHLITTKTLSLFDVERMSTGAMDLVLAAQNAEGEKVSLG